MKTHSSDHMIVTTTNSTAAMMTARTVWACSEHAREGEEEKEDEGAKPHFLKKALLVPPVGHVQNLGLVRVQPSTVVEQVSAQDVFFTEDQLVVEQEEAALLHFALSDDSSQLAGVDQLRAALQDIRPLQRHVFEKLPLEPVDVLYVAEDGLQLQLGEHVRVFTALADVTLQVAQNQLVGAAVVVRSVKQLEDIFTWLFTRPAYNQIKESVKNSTHILGDERFPPQPYLVEHRDLHPWLELTPSNAVQSDGRALGEGGGPEPGGHGSVGGDLVGGDGRPRQKLLRRDKNKHPGL
ncbi:hypothetical protein EYF80_000755 [Liparis tanakae]|uniref:Uncharacterized protein n=1 Tax=Liparis tanakae TaxID=230148 RepID=A0A4Z2JFW4_9TELE|nr:hypothetical protein EYF80_000755 [Liparis tanakae]